MLSILVFDYDKVYSILDLEKGILDQLDLKSISIYIVILRPSISLEKPHWLSCHYHNYYDNDKVNIECVP